MSTDLQFKHIAAEALTKSITRRIGINKYNIARIKMMVVRMVKKHKTVFFSSIVFWQIVYCAETSVCQAEAVSFLYIIFKGFDSIVCLLTLSVSVLKRKNMGCWPLWRSHQSQTVGFQAIIGTAVEVCSWVDSSGKVKVHFIYQDSPSYQTQQWANWYFRPLKLPFSHKAGTVHKQDIHFGAVLLVVLCYSRLCCGNAVHSVSVMAICFWITRSKKKTKNIFSQT